MRSTRLDLFIQFLLGVGLIVSGILLIRVNRTAAAFGSGIDPVTAGKIYHARMEATETLLSSGELDPDGQ
ncbi:MAG: hypothetical protein ABIL25_02345 [candidate division WOR-3 bacterium]